MDRRYCSPLNLRLRRIVFRVASLFFYRLILCLRDDMRTKIEIRAKKDYLFRLILYCEQEQGYSGIHSRGQ